MWSLQNTPKALTVFIFVSLTANATRIITKQCTHLCSVSQADLQLNAIQIKRLRFSKHSAAYLDSIQQQNNAV